MTRDPDVPVPTVETSRYGKLPEIHHIFNGDPQSPPIVITLAFVGTVLAAFPVLAVLVSIALVSGIVSGRTLTDLLLVAFPRRQCQPSSHRSEIRSYPSRRVPWIACLTRRDLFPVLYFLEPLPDSSCRRRGRHGCLRQRQPCAGRGPGPTPCGTSVNSSGTEFAGSSLALSLSQLPCAMPLHVRVSISAHV